MQKRKIVDKVKGFSTSDGAGVNLVRVLSNKTVERYDPLLMLDSFDSRNYDEVKAGFPFHPHRGIETVSYLKNGAMTHKDSLGNEDTITDGEVQWMTAGSGILHEEMILQTDRQLGVQLWLNLSKKDKMTHPNYHAIKNKDIDEIEFDGGKLRLLAGNYKDHKGYLGNYQKFDFYDIELNDESEITIDTDFDSSITLFTLLGEIEVDGTKVKEKTAAKLSKGDSVTIKAINGDADILFISSEELNEPVAWGGPIVMNTKEEIYNAFHELDNGNFIKEEAEIE